MTKRGKKARTKWRRLISEQARSGQTVTAFCRERGLCRPYFFAWKKRLREDTAVKFLEVQLTEAAPKEAGDSCVEIRLQNGRSLLVGSRVRCRACARVTGGGGDGVVIGLPSLQAVDRAQETRIWLASEAMDMRCGFDRLAERVRAVIGEDPLSGHWFVFHSR